MTTTRTIVYLLNDEKNDSISFLMDALSEYILNHPDKISFAKKLSAQLIYCKDMFTIPYEVNKQ